MLEAPPPGKHQKKDELRSGGSSEHVLYDENNKNTHYGRAMDQ